MGRWLCGAGVLEGPGGFLGGNRAPQFSPTAAGPTVNGSGASAVQIPDVPDAAGYAELFTVGEKTA